MEKRRVLTVRDTEFNRTSLRNVVIPVVRKHRTDTIIHLRDLRNWPPTREDRDFEPDVN